MNSFTHRYGKQPVEDVIHTTSFFIKGQPMSLHTVLCYDILNTIIKVIDHPSCHI